MSPKKTLRPYLAAGALLAVIAPAVGALLHHPPRAHRSRLADFLRDPAAGDEGWRERMDVREERHERELARDEDRDEEGKAPESRGDDALRRVILSRVQWGKPTAEATRREAALAHQEALRWHVRGTARPLRGSAALTTASATSPGLDWVNLGPVDAAFEYNGVQYSGNDSGRPNTILTDPRDANVAYLATSGGGIWKAYDFLGGSPTWVPITEGIGNLAIGAMALDPQAPDTLYAGLGDFVDGAGGQVIKSTDGGATWSAPVALTGTYGGSLHVSALRIRALAVDPNGTGVVLVGTDVGLFRSTDAGQTFALVDLPNSGTAVAESVWTIVYTGQSGGTAHWVVSGVAACDVSSLPPDPGGGTVAGSGCTLGNPGTVWTSSDDGASFSARALPSGVTAGRITLAAGSTSDVAHTVVYAQLGSEDEQGAPAGAGILRSTDSGATWTSLGTTVANPTTPSPGYPPDCGDANVSADQAWYNTTVAVDPSDANHVLIGGELCGIRTVNGLSATPTWENVAHWLPAGGGGDVGGGTLPYVHADWHASLILRTASGYLALAGTDGGLFVSSNLFDVTPTSIVWNSLNRGLVTHLMYALGSGEPAGGNAYVAIAGMQDNGTRIRQRGTGADPTVFDQVIGGDGIGAVVSTDIASGSQVLWASAEYSHAYCSPASNNNYCDRGSAWGNRDPSLTCSGDDQPFFVRYALAPASPSKNTVLTNTNEQIFRNSGVGAWAAISPCGGSLLVRNIFASPTTDGLYGAAMSGGHFQVTSNCTGTTTACTWDVSNPLGVDLDGSGTVDANESLFYTSAMDFPPVTPSGYTAGDVYLAASAAWTMLDGSPVPDALGHLFITHDRGLTWAAFHGNGTGSDLPNVRINVVKYDPSDTSGNTLWVGTALGIYRTTDGGQTWQRYGQGLPMASVEDLFLSQNGGLLRVATYGRGLWELYPNATAEHGVAGDGDWDRNLLIDGFDLAAMGRAMGTNASTQTQPTYDWNLDLTGTTSGIDDADLAAEVARFGDHP